MSAVRPLRAHPRHRLINEFVVREPVLLPYTIKITLDCAHIAAARKLRSSRSRRSGRRTAWEDIGALYWGEETGHSLGRRNPMGRGASGRSVGGRCGFVWGSKSRRALRAHHIGRHREVDFMTPSHYDKATRTGGHIG